MVLLAPLRQFRPLQKLASLSSWPAVETPEQRQRVDTFVMIYDQSTLQRPLRFKQILARVRAETRRHPRFQQVYRPAQLFFAAPQGVLDERFNAEHHARHIALPKPGDWRQLSIQIARLHARPLDPNRPLWEINVIEGLDHIPGLAPGHFALVCKIHHWLMEPDGHEDFVWSLHDGVGQARPEPQPRSKRGYSPLAPLLDLALDGSERLLRPVMEPVKHSALFLNRQWHELQPLVRLWAGGTIGRRQVPYSRFNTAVSSFRVWEGRVVPMHQIRTLCERVPGVTEYDVLIALIAGALRQYLRDQGELKNRVLWALAPSEQGFSDPAIDHPQGTLITRLATDIADPLERLQVISQWRAGRRPVQAEETADEGPRPRSPLQAISVANGEIHRRQRDEAAGNPLYNTALIGFSTDTEPQSLLGANMVYCSAVPEIAEGLGLVHLACHHGDHLVLTFTSCREMLPNPSHYRQCLSHSLTELLKVTA